MKISGFTFVRNAIKFDYPIVESIFSILPIVDEYIVNVGDSEDETLELIRSISSPKIKIIESKWDENLREGGMILAEQTNLALAETSGDWCFYLQADEVVHEKYLDKIYSVLSRFQNEKKVEGILFKFIHFYGGYRTYFDLPHRFYQKEIRIIRNKINISAWKDAQGFRKEEEKLNVVEIDADIYHYGWVRPPEIMLKKCMNFDRYWHPDEWIKEKYKIQEQIYNNLGGLKYFNGTHPQVMSRRIENTKWTFTLSEKEIKLRGFERIRTFFENLIGQPIGEYKNYKLLKLK